MDEAIQAFEIPMRLQNGIKILGKVFAISDFTLRQLVKNMMEAIPRFPLEDIDRSPFLLVDDQVSLRARTVKGVTVLGHHRETTWIEWGVGIGSRRNQGGDRRIDVGSWTQ